MRSNKGKTLQGQKHRQLQGAQHLPKGAKTIQTPSKIAKVKTPSKIAKSTLIQTYTKIDKMYSNTKQNGQKHDKHKAKSTEKACKLL